MSEALRDKSARLRRQHILEAATRVFAQRGFHRATIREIAIEAGIADGTIYKAFENKSALLLALLDPLDERSSAAGHTGSNVDAERFIRSMIHDAWRRLSPVTLDVLRTVVSEALVDPEFRALYLERVIAPALSLPEPILGHLVAAKRLASVEPELIIRLLTGAIMGFVLLRLLGDPWVLANWERLADDLADMVLDGLVPVRPDGNA